MANIFKAKTLVGRTGIFSHEITAPNLVYNTGNQNIGGNKTFVNNIEVQGTGIFNSVDLSNISEFQFSGVTINLVDTNTYVSGGWIYISGNPVLTGSQSISTINLNNLVYTTGNQTIEGIKDFNNIINVSGVKFDILTTSQIPVHQEGVLYYSDDNKTLNLDLDVANLKLLVGQENIVRAKNLTNSTMSPGTVVYISGAQGNTPLVARSIATEDATSARTLGVAAHSINDNSKGYFTTFGLVEGIDTSAYSVGQTLYLSHEVSGGLTGVKPQAPNHIVRIGNVIDQGNNGSIFVDVQNGFELDELHDVRIINQQNKDGLVYNSASGLWLNVPVLTGDENLNRNLNELVVNNIVYTTGNQTINGLKTFTSGIDIYSGTNPQTLRIFNRTGTNSGEFGLIGWQNNNLIIGPQATNSGILRDLILTGNNININASGLFNIFDNTNIVGNLNVTGNILLSGNQVLTGSSTLYATSANLASTGSTLNTKIDNLSGVSVLTFGNQTINGLKTFTSGIDIYSGTSSQSFRVFNRTGLNSGEYGIFGWKNNQLIIGAENTQSGILRDVTVTGQNIRVIPNQIFEISNIDSLLLSGLSIVITGSSINILGGRPFVNGTGVLLSGEAAGPGGGGGGDAVYITGNQNVGGNKTFTGVVTFSGQEVNLIDTALNLSGAGDMTFTSTNINFINSPVLISGTNLRVSGNILLSGLLITNQRPTVNGTGVLLSGEAAQVDLSTTVRTTGDQSISGIKNFQSIPKVSGRDIYYQKDVYYFTGNNFTPDSNLARTFEYILTGNAGASATLNAPINMYDGENIVIKIKQSANGSNNMQFNASYKFPGSVIPSLTLTADKADIYTVLKVGTSFYSTYVKDFID